MTFNRGDLVRVSGFHSEFVREGDFGIVIGQLGSSIKANWFNPLIFNQDGGTAWYAPEKYLTKIEDSGVML